MDVGFRGLTTAIYTDPDPLSRSCGHKRRDPAFAADHAGGTSAEPSPTPQFKPETEAAWPESLRTI
jgi:hypothetical protein